MEGKISDDLGSILTTSNVLKMTALSASNDPTAMPNIPWSSKSTPEEMLKPNPRKILPVVPISVGVIF